MSPLCNLGRKFEHKNGQILTEDLFFKFWCSPNFGLKNRLILSGEVLLLVFIILKFPAPLSKILRTPLAILSYFWAYVTYIFFCVDETYVKHFSLSNQIWIPIFGYF